VAELLALRRKGVDARLVVFNRELRHPEADWSLERRGGFARQQLTQWRAFARLLPQTDVFHFYFGLTLAPKSAQTERAYGTKVPLVPATKESLVDALRPLVESPALRGEIGAASAYVERVHDIDRIADRLVGLHERL
jgi:hypothetical protein